MYTLFKTSLIFFSLLCIQQLWCENTSQAPTYNNNYNPHIEPHIEPKIYITNSSALSVKIGDITLQCIQKIKETVTHENYKLLKYNLQNILWEYRYHIICGTVLGSYIITATLLLADYYHYLHANTLWAYWKQNCSFEDLCNLPQKELTYELLHTINQRYYNKNHPTDFAYPLITFIATINTEINICKRYIKMAKIIKQLHLLKIFPTNDTKINEVTRLLERTLFIKHLFLSWLAEYNIANNQKS